MKNRAIAVGIGLLALVGGIACDGPQGQAGNTNSPGIEKFRRAGPEEVTLQPVGSCTRFLPPQSGANTRPGLGWSNGTFARPANYEQILRRVASFGTLVTAANTTQSGSGAAESQCIDELDAARNDSNGRFASSGHSQGGSGSINAGPLNNKIVVSCPVQLDGTVTARSDGANLRGSANGPAVIMCGSADILAPCNRQGNGDGKFNESRVPTIILTAVGAPHIGNGSPANGNGNSGLYPALVTACVEAALDGDAQALAALRPGGVANSGALTNIRRRGF